MNPSTSTASSVSRTIAASNVSAWQLFPILLVATVLTQATNAAVTVSSVTEDPGIIQTVKKLHPVMNGALMAGALVEVGDVGGVIETAFWSPIGANSGAAEGTMLGWRLSLTGDSGGNPLVLERLDSTIGSNGIAYVAIDLMPDHQIAVFDDNEPDPGTPGTVGGTNPWNGLLAGSVSTLGWDVDVTYRDMVALGGNPPAKDAYRQLRIDFSQPFIGGDRMEYLADSDRVLPEPASLALFGMGGMLLAFRGRQR